MAWRCWEGCRHLWEGQGASACDPDPWAGSSLHGQSGQSALLLSLGLCPEASSRSVCCGCWGCGRNRPLALACGRFPRACRCSCKLPPPSCLHLPSQARPQAEGTWGECVQDCPSLSAGGGEASGSLAVRMMALGSGEPPEEWATDPAHSFPAHAPTTPSTANETAVPVSAAPGCRPSQHPLACLQPFPVPNFRASHDSHPWPTHHVCTASRGVVGHGPQPSQCGHHSRLLQGTGGMRPEAQV